MEYLELIDRQLFLFLNSLHNPTSDLVMFWISSKLLWISLYVLVLVTLIKKYKFESIRVIITFILLIIITDQVSVNLFKNVFLRYRPTHNLEIQNLVHTVNNYLGGKYGFISSHAANVFGFAMLSSFFIKNKSYSYMIFGWAAVVSYSRIALGVHYPSDIFAGGVVGVAFAIILFKIFLLFDRKKIKLLNKTF